MPGRAVWELDRQPASMRSGKEVGGPCRGKLRHGSCHEPLWTGRAGAVGEGAGKAGVYLEYVGELYCTRPVSLTDIFVESFVGQYSE